MTTDGPNTTPHTLASMRDRKMTLLQMLDEAGDSPMTIVALESLCLEAAHEIRRLNGEIERLNQPERKHLEN